VPRLLVGWGCRYSAAAAVQIPWAGDARDLAAATLSAPWSESSPAWRSLDAEPRLLLEGDQIAPISARLSADEDSPYWMANITLARRGDYDRLPKGAAFTLILAGEHYALVVDGRTLSRPDGVDEIPAITARSPLCLLDAPFASPVTVANQAARSG
jgi:hypothetical protein